MHGEKGQNGRSLVVRLPIKPQHGHKFVDIGGVPSPFLFWIGLIGPRAAVDICIFQVNRAEAQTTRRQALMGTLDG